MTLHGEVRFAAIAIALTIIETPLLSGFADALAEVVLLDALSANGSVVDHVVVDAVGVSLEALSVDQLVAGVAGGAAVVGVGAAVADGAEIVVEGEGRVALLATGLAVCLASHDLALSVDGQLEGGLALGAFVATGV